MEQKQPVTVAFMKYLNSLKSTIAIPEDKKITESYTQVYLEVFKSSEEKLQKLNKANSLAYAATTYMNKCSPEYTCEQLVDNVVHMLERLKALKQQEVNLKNTIASYKTYTRTVKGMSKVSRFI